MERTAALWQYQTAAAAAPLSSDVFHQLGAALRGHDEPRAARAFGRALALSPLHAPSFLALGQALLADGRPNDATRCLRRALCLQPGLEAAAVQLAALKPPAPDSDGDESPEQLAAEQHMERAEELSDRAEHAAAIRELQAAVRLVPWHELPYVNLAAVQGATRDPAQLEGAAVALRAAIAGGLRSSLLHQNLAVTLSHLEREAEALPHYLEAARLDPQASPGALAKWISARLDECDWKGHEELAVHVQSEPEHVGLLELSRTGQPSLALAAASSRSEALRLTASGASRPSSRSWHRRPSRTSLRVAYISADLLPEHPIGKLLLPLLECHDPERFHITLFSSSAQGGAAARKRLARKGFALRETARDSSSQALAESVAAARPHLAIELNSHTRGGRLDAMALRPAPVSATFLGYTGTSGATFIDYLPADRILVPPTTLRRYYTERLVYLSVEHVSHHALVFRSPPTEEAQPQQRRPRMAMSSWNAEKKVGADDWHVWNNIARRRPSVLLQQVVSRPAASGAQRLLEEARAAGLHAPRVALLRRVDQAGYFARIAASQLALDAPRWNGVSSSLDVLWAGSPLVTMPLQMMLARMGAALSRAIGSTDLVCASWREYEDASSGALL